MPKLLLFILLLSLSVPLAAQDNLTYDDCPFALPPGEVEGETIDCGYLSVPENHADPASPLIELAFAILYSDDPADDPILYLEGGPGGSALSGIGDWARSPLRAGRDIILFDQRGTGYSQPYLGCDDEAEEAVDAAQECRDTLREAGVDLTAYHSAASVQDITALRLALEIDEWNLLGISYGTRLALTVMRDEPEGIRSVILDSVYPPQVQSIEEQSLVAVGAFKTLFLACEADTACRTAYPDLEAVFYNMLDDLNNNPIIIEAEDPDTGELLEDELTGADIVNMLSQALYDTSIIPYLPLAIMTAAAGDYEAAIDLFESGGGGISPSVITALQAHFSARQIEAIIAIETEDLTDDEMDDLLQLFTDEDLDLMELLLYGDPDAEEVSDAGGMYNSVECHEEIAFNNLDRALDGLNSLPGVLQEQYAEEIETTFAICDVWQAGRGDPIEVEPVESDIPTLVLAGAFDPVTPPAWAEDAARYLPNSYYVLFPHAGHSLLEAGSCAISVYQQFLENPNRAPDNTCAAGLQVDFVIE